MENLIVATKNKGKMKEIRKLFAGFPYVVLSMEEVGVDLDVDESGATFEENALIKAREIQKISGGTVLSDDSGLEVDALLGEPGIYSARYGGEGLDDHGRTLLLLKNLQGFSMEARCARFVCAAAMVSNAASVVVRGEVEGHILFEPHGVNGFGYDPVFLVEDSGKTAAEMSDEEKNLVSHRGRALRKLMETDMVKDMRIFHQNSKFIT